jgi:hypothetical protein
MQIKNGGIYRNIDEAEFSYYKEKGYVPAELEPPAVPEAALEQPSPPVLEDKPKGK